MLHGRAEVHLFSIVHPDERAHVNDVRSWLSSVTVAEPPALLNKVKAVFSLPGRRPLTHTLLDAPGIANQLEQVVELVHPDVVFAYCTGMARFALEPPLARIACVLDMVDVDSEKWRGLGETAQIPWRWIYAREARVLRTFETRAVRHAAMTLVVNSREAKAVESIAPRAPVVVVENGIDLEFFRPPSPPEASAAVVFCGVMDYQPNIDAVTWFARQVWPFVRVSRPDSRFIIVGANPTPLVKELARIPGVEVTGAVPDVRPYLWQAAVSVAPLRMARGLQNKVLEALAAGLPVVMTEAVADGLPADVFPGCVVAEQAHAFGAAVSTLLAETPARRRSMAASADLTHLTWRSRLEAVPGILAAAAATKP
jgi:sugar transferase (PEP-CTERM/EpsH1 system associated)